MSDKSPLLPPRPFLVATLAALGLAVAASQIPHISSPHISVQHIFQQMASLVSPTGQNQSGSQQQQQQQQQTRQSRETTSRRPPPPPETLKHIPHGVGGGAGSGGRPSGQSTPNPSQVVRLPPIFTQLLEVFAALLALALVASLAVAIAARLSSSFRRRLSRRRRVIP